MALKASWFVMASQSFGITFGVCAESKHHKAVTLVAVQCAADKPGKASCGDSAQFPQTPET
jgi:hypothetical protein